MHNDCIVHLLSIEVIGLRTGDDHLGIGCHADTTDVEYTRNQEWGLDWALVLRSALGFSSSHIYLQKQRLKPSQVVCYLITHLSIKKQRHSSNILKKESNICQGSCDYVLPTMTVIKKCFAIRLYQQCFSASFFRVFTCMLIKWSPRLVWWMNLFLWMVWRRLTASFEALLMFAFGWKFCVKQLCFHLGQMGFQFAGKAIYTAVWVGSVSLFMELLGFSTQRWLTAGGLGTVLLTLAGREVLCFLYSRTQLFKCEILYFTKMFSQTFTVDLFWIMDQILTNFLSSVMIHATRPFILNDWIQTKIEGYEVSGTVEVNFVFLL